MKSKCCCFPVRTIRFSFHLLLCSQLLLAHHALGANFYAGTSPATVPWTNGIVPYEFTNTLSAAQKQTYLDGLREWELAANVKFVPHTNQTRWILFAFNSNNFNNVSSGYNPQIVNIASLSRAQVAHEMGHSFGLQHENIRPDQTNYLTILSNNVAPGNLPALLADATTVTNGPYDFESVMHLARDFGSLQPGVLDTQLVKPAYTRYQPRMGNYTLSPGDRAALKYLYGPPLVPLTNVVTTTADAGPGSLRAAMYYATDHPTAAVQFNIPTSDPGYSNGVFNIHLTGQLPTLVSNAMIIDGSTQPGFTDKPLIVVNASQILPETFTSGTLLVYSGNNQLKNLSIRGFNWNGITLLYAAATNNTIAGCWIGLDSSGSTAAPNAKQGILMDQAASGNTVGGISALTRNVISGNREYGIWISGSNTTGNLVLGNYIGTDATGSFAVSNASGGVILTGATHHNTIGGINSIARNILSGNGNAGLWLTGTDVAGNFVQKNFIGVNASGTAALPNTFAGIYVLSGAQSNLIANNVISGNAVEGIRLAGGGVTANTVQGNYLGTDATGTSAVPNGFLGLSLYSGATGNTIGGTSSLSRNVISGNGSEGLRIQGAGAAWNVIQGNFIGTTASGTAALPNGWSGLTIFSGATSNVIGGTSAGARNILSGNWTYGLVIADPGTSGNLIQGNFIGLATNGSTALPNYAGVVLASGATSNLLGGTTSAARNVISGNYGSGIEMRDGNTAGNLIQGNYIGLNSTGTSANANGGEGIYMETGANHNLIGGAAAGAGNVISGNTYRGIYAYGLNTADNLIQGNFIGTQADGTNALGNNWDGIVFYNGASSNIVGLATDGSGAGNRIAFNGFSGAYVGSDNADPCLGNTIRGNAIHSNGGLGLDLAGPAFFGVTANDSGDGDAGPNNLQNYPVITNAVTLAGSSTSVSGTLNSTAGRVCLIDLYRNTSPDPSGYGEGRTYVQSVTVTNSGSGNSVFNATFAGDFSGQYFSATATDKLTGDTSEFSRAVLATNGLAAPAFFAPFSLTSTGFVAKISLTIGQNYRVQAATNLEANPIAWLTLTNFTATVTNFAFLDRAATNLPLRFYRAVSP